MVTLDTWKRGSINGLRTSWMLLKIMVPVYAAVTLLGHTPVIGWTSRIFEPLMSLTGLPGEAAIAFATGSLINIYAAMGIILAMNLNWYQMTIMAVMLNFSHELIVEAAILKKTGITVWPIITLRVVGAFAVAMLMNALGRAFLG